MPGYSTLLTERAQGRPGADLAPAVCCANVAQWKTAQQHTGGAEHSAFPARWVDGLCRALPGAEFLLASLAPRIDDVVDPVGRSTPPQGLAVATTARTTRFCRTHGPLVRRIIPRPCRRCRENAGETKPDSAARPARGFGLTGTTRPARTSRTRRCRVHRKPGSQSRRRTIAPQG